MTTNMCAYEYAMSRDCIFFLLQLLTLSRAETTALFSCRIYGHPRLATPVRVVEPTRRPLTPGAAAVAQAAELLPGLLPSSLPGASFPLAWEIPHLLCWLQVLGFHPHPHGIDASSQTKSMGSISRKAVRGLGGCFSYLNTGVMTSWVQNSRLQVHI